MRGGGLYPYFSLHTYANSRTVNQYNTTLHENEIYMADTYGQKCGIEINPNPLDQFLQEGGIKNQTPPEIPCSRYN